MERILLCRRKFLPLKVDPFLEGFSRAGIRAGSYYSFFSLYKIAEKNMKLYSLTLRFLYYSIMSYSFI